MSVNYFIMIEGTFFRYDYVIYVQIPFRNLYIDSAFMKSVILGGEIHDLAIGRTRSNIKGML